MEFLVWWRIDLSAKKLLTVVPGLGAALIVFLNWLRPAQIGDFGRGIIVGVLIALSILAVAKRRICTS